MELFKLGIKAAREGLAKGDFTSEELVRAVIDRVHAENPRIGAYLTFDEEGALAAARANPKAVPIAVKDLINVKGQPCTCGSKILEGYVSPYDATVIRNLKAHDFICAGRVNMDEFAMGSSTENSALGRTVNPYDPARVPGGSSGAARRPWAATSASRPSARTRAGRSASPRASATASASSRATGA